MKASRSPGLLSRVKGRTSIKNNGAKKRCEKSREISKKEQQGGAKGRRAAMGIARCKAGGEHAPPFLSVDVLYDILPIAGVPWECYRAYAELRRRYALCVIR